MQTFRTIWKIVDAQGFTSNDESVAENCGYSKNICSNYTKNATVLACKWQTESSLDICIETIYNVAQTVLETMPVLYKR